MPENLHDQIKRERDAANPDAKNLAVYRRYAEGDQDQTLTPDMRLLLGMAARHPYADNVADMVLQAWASRLVLTGFDVEDQGVADFLSGLYMRNHLGDLCYDVNYATGRDGNHALMLRWLPEDQEVAEDATAETGELLGEVRMPGGRVTIHSENWWDGKSGVWVAYDDRGRPAYAVKDFTVWVDQPSGGPQERNRRTVYFPDRIQRYIEDGQGWKPYPLPGEPDGGIVEWTKRDGSPLGIPVVHFAYRRFGHRTYGTSEFAGGFLANQDHLNDIQQDLVAAARLLGFQILTATGAEFASTPKLEPGTLLYTARPDAHFGSIPAGDVKQLVDAHGLKLQTVARMTATPIHIITGGDWPAGIALVQAEKPLIAKVLRLAASIGPKWSEVAHRSTEIANAFGPAQLNEDAEITAVFSDPEQLDQLAQAEVEKAKAEAQVAVETLSDEESLIALGYTAAEARARLKRREERAARAMERETGILDQNRQAQEVRPEEDDEE